MSGFDYHKDGDDIVTIIMDMPGQSANTMTPAFLQAMNGVIDRLRAEPDLKGVIFTSAKKTFVAGADLRALLEIDKADEATFAMVVNNKAPYRALEKLPIPVVAAINGAALGGGFELCLACSRRIVADLEHAVVGLPEVTLGLLPGAGGIVRLTCLVGLERALPLLLNGTRLRPTEALEAGLVDAVVASVEELVPAAKAWIKENPGAHLRSWDQKGFTYPGGSATAPNIRQFVAAAPALLVTKTRHLMPAPEKILDVAVNSMRTGFDAALRAESRGLTALLATKEAKAAITTFFFGVQAVKAGGFRPAGEHWQARSAALFGAGAMASGIARAHASKGLPTVLKATETSQGGGVYDIIIEAVDECLEVKEHVIRASFESLAAEGIYGSTSSTLPISTLAESCADPTRFVGLHFFASFEKMKLVEIIVGKRTSDATLRKSYDYVQQLGHMPIVVNDAPGFFAARVCSVFRDEGLQLLQDGMNPVAIERAAWKVGMPLGPLAVHDEATPPEFTANFGPQNTATRAVNTVMVELKRGGRADGRGLYDYGSDGTKRLWSGLSRFKLRDAKVPLVDAADRLLYRQAIETLRCLDEGVLRSETEANLGSIVAMGFPSQTGGALQFIRGIGIDDFATRSADLAQRYGERFAINGPALDKLRRAKPVVV